MRKTAASVLLLALAAVASISSLEGAAAAAAEGIETTNPSPASPSPAPSPPEEAGPSVNSSTHSNHAQHKAAATGPPVQVPDGPCFADPSAGECANFTRPKGSWLPELSGLCDAMDYMPGCTLWRECKASNRNEGYCHHPSLVGTICTEMPKMKGCEPWNALCRRGSTVPHCLRPGPLPDAPSTPDATKAVQAMCSSHSMPGCEACRQGAAAGAEGCREPLAALAVVCASMPGMRDCKQLAAACSGENATTFFPKTCALLATSPGGKKTKGEKTAGGSASLAGSGASLPSSFDLPPMRMFLHADTEDIVLARQWVPRSPGAVAAACLGAIAGGFLSQALRAARGAAEAAVAARLLRGGEGGLFSSPAAGARLGRNALRAAATFASSLLDLLLMLVAMTFSWPLILSVAAGYGLGALVFGALGEPRLGDGGARGESGDGRPPSAAADGFATSEGVHLHGGTEGLDGASCCDMGGGIGRAKLSPTPGGNGDAAKGRGGWFGKP